MRYVRHAKRSPSRAAMLAANLKRRPPKPAQQDVAEEDACAGYRTERSGAWIKLIGPDGQQVGKSVRTEAEAWALLEDL